MLKFFKKRANFLYAEYKSTKRWVTVVILEGGHVDKFRRNSSSGLLVTEVETECRKLEALTEVFVLYLCLLLLR